MVRSLFVFLCLLIGIESDAAAQPLPVRDYLRQPDYTGAALSRDGRRVAVTIPLHGRMNLAVVDLETRKAKAITSYDDYDVLRIRWVGSEYLLFSVGITNEVSGWGRGDFGGLFAIHRDGGNVRTLAGTARQQMTGKIVTAIRQYEFVGSLDSEEEFIAAGNQRDPRATDLYRLNARTGRAQLLTTVRPERTEEWVLDRNNVARAAVSSVRDSFTKVVHYRKSEDSPWEEIARFDPMVDPVGLIPLGVDADSKTLLVASGSGRDTVAIHRYDPQARKMGELLAHHPRYDMGAYASGQYVGGGVIRERKSGEVVGFSVNADKYQVAWIDPEYERIQAMIDKALPRTVNLFELSDDRKRALVTAYSDVMPVRWHLLDVPAAKLEMLTVSRPWMKPEHLVEMRPFLLKTRDGLEIPSYYFLPATAKPGERLPTVVHIHGGPAVRADTWGAGFGVSEAQLLASRGYAVILPNFRITPGLGRTIYAKGIGAIGRQMSNDHEDAAKWGIEQGFVDPERVCISGASYGGYATMMALARAPQMFRCGVAGLMVSDWPKQTTSFSGDTAWSEMGEAYVLRMIGVKDVKDIPSDISPINLADRIKAPMLIYAGRDDIRTPIEQTEGMVRALERAGNPPRKLIVKADEGHGFGKVDNRVDLYAAVLEFLDEQIGRRKP